MEARAACPFHEGEQEMHFRTGVWQEVESLGRRMIKPAVTPPQAEVLRQLPMLLVTMYDRSGRLWASALTGSPGFLGAQPDPSVLSICSARLLGDGLLTLRPGQHVGCLAIQLSSRRRVRVKGVVQSVERTAAGLLSLQVRVQQAYGNCPKYIQKRTLKLETEPRPVGSGASAQRSAGALGAAQCAMVAAADTFFIASSSGPPPPPEGSGGSGSGKLPAAATAFGCDISHRGGPPGFVQVEDEGSTLRWGDYEGNDMFNTLGNLLVNRACSLLFLDFRSGDALLVAGEAEVLHKDRELPGAQRAVRFAVQEWAHLHGALPLREEGEVGFSPFNPAMPAALHSL